jgi:hypothetical protein
MSFTKLLEDINLVESIGVDEKRPTGLKGLLRREGHGSYEDSNRGKKPHFRIIDGHIQVHSGDDNWKSQSGDYDHDDHAKKISDTLTKHGIKHEVLSKNTNAKIPYSSSIEVTSKVKRDWSHVPKTERSIV